MSADKRQFGVGGVVVWLLLGLIVLGIILMAVLRKEDAVLDEPAEKAVPVRAMTVKPRAIPDRLSLPGRIEPFVETRLSAETGGRITALPVAKGDDVEAGQVLLRLDARLWDAVLKRSTIEKREADKGVVRWEELRETGAVSDSDFDAVVTRRDMADAALAEAEAFVSKCETRAPVAGRIDDRYVELGEYVAEGAPAFRLVVTDPVKVAVEIPERNVLAVAVGQDLPFHVSAAPGREYTGTVAFVSAQAGRQGNSFRAELVCPNAEGLLRPGMIVETSLLLGLRQDAIVLPLAAVIPQKGEHIVFTIEDNRAVRNVVRIDSILGQDVVIRGGLKAGDRVIFEGHRGLQDGMLVELASPQ